MIEFDREIGEEDEQSNRELHSDQSSCSNESCSEPDIVNTVNSDIFVGTSSQDSYTRAINEENIYPSILNRVCLNSPYTAECAPDMRSSLELAPMLVTSSVSLEELVANSYSNSHISTPPIASDAVNFGTENISNAFLQFFSSSNSATSCQTEAGYIRC